MEDRYWHTTTAGTGKETGTGYRAGVSSMPRKPEDTMSSASGERYWHTTTAGAGKETGIGFRPGVSSMPKRASSPTRSAFHPTRHVGEHQYDTGVTRRKNHPAVKPEFPETGANLGDKDVYRYERVGTALWSSVLNNTSVGRDVSLDALNSNYLEANRGEPKTYVQERLGTLLHSSSLDQFAQGVKTPSQISSVRSAASSKALSNLAKVEELEAKIAEEKKKRASLENLQQLAKAA